MLQRDVVRVLAHGPTIQAVFGRVNDAYAEQDAAVIIALDELAVELELHQDSLTDLSGILGETPAPRSEADAAQLITLISFAVEERSTEAACTIGRSVLILLLLEQADEEMAGAFRSLVDQQLCVELVQLYADTAEVLAALQRI